jgi:hypothetical protein
MGYNKKLKVIEIIRNASFEPSHGKIKWIDKCLEDISTAFFWQKPAVICSHRVNYVGNISPDNRQKGLEELDYLLFSIKEKWPDVEFLNTVELASLVKDTDNV